MQRQTGCDQIKSLLLQGQKILVRHETWISPQSRLFGIDRGAITQHDPAHPATVAQRVSKQAIACADIQGKLKGPRNIGQALNQTIRDLTEQEIMIPRPRCRAVPSMTQNRAIKYYLGVTGHGLSLSHSADGSKSFPNLPHAFTVAIPHSR